MAFDHDNPNLRTPISGAMTLLQRSLIPTPEQLVRGPPATDTDEGASASNGLRKANLDYWKATLAGAPPLLELPTDRPRPSVMSYAGGRVAVLLSDELTAGIRSLGQRHGATLFMTLLLAWSILLSRLTQRGDVVIGTPVPNHRHSDLDSLSCCSANTLALRVRLTPTQQVAELLQKIKASTLEAVAHQDVPLIEIVDALELPCDLSYHPIYQTMLALDERQTVEDDELAEAQVRAKFDLTLALTDTGKNISGFLEYASDLFERSTIIRMTGQLQAVFEAIVANDHPYLGAPKLLSEDVAAIDGNAVSSAARLGHIRHALERMGAIQDPLNAETPAHLLIRLDGNTAVWHVLGERTTIGRTAENDVRIDAEFISRRHAVALRDGDDTVIEDLKSTNGTYVNGERISRHTLKNGDVVALGTMEFHFSLNETPA
jgi:Condensation domain/FHA domain